MVYANRWARPQLTVDCYIRELALPLGVSFLLLGAVHLLAAGVGAARPESADRDVCCRPVDRPSLGNDA